jgi:hypothetical protein
MVWTVVELWCQVQNMVNEMEAIASWSLHIGDR